MSDEREPLKVSRDRTGIWRVMRGREVLVEHLTKVAAYETKTMLEATEHEPASKISVR